MVIRVRRLSEIFELSDEVTIEWRKLYNGEVKKFIPNEISLGRSNQGVMGVEDMQNAWGRGNMYTKLYWKT